MTRSAACARFHGQMGMFTRALDLHSQPRRRRPAAGLSEDAVLNANYILRASEGPMSPAFEGYCMHEALFSDGF